MSEAAILDALDVFNWPESGLAVAWTFIGLGLLAIVCSWTYKAWRMRREADEVKDQLHDELVQGAGAPGTAIWPLSSELQMRHSPGVDSSMAQVGLTAKEDLPAP